MQEDRLSEWFVPKFGPRRFRVGVGILFLPYTAIVTCFAALGAITEPMHTERIIAISIVYILALGVGAHLLDAVGGKTKPWGSLPKRKIWSVAIGALATAYAIGLYYAFLDSPLLFPIGILEGFFLLAYNLEWFGGRLHNKPATIVSWGILPVFAGSAIQTNSISLETIIISGFTSLITYILISTSRPYKILVQRGGDTKLIKKKEIILKVLSITVVIGTITFFIIRHNGLI